MAPSTENLPVQIGIELLSAAVEALIGLFKRHQQGENVTKDLNELLDKVRDLKFKEQAIANAPLTTNDLIAGLNK